MIIVDKLYKGFEGTQVLKGISTTFESGKTSLIIGQSGSGKTVFLKSLIGLHVPERGTISLMVLSILSLPLNKKDNGDKRLVWCFKEAHYLIHKLFRKM